MGEMVKITALKTIDPKPETQITCPICGISKFYLATLLNFEEDINCPHCGALIEAVV